MNQDIVCPFCGLESFDLIGLKRHYHHGNCDVFNDTPYNDGGDGPTAAECNDILGKPEHYKP